MYTIYKNEHNVSCEQEQIQRRIKDIQSLRKLEMRSRSMLHTQKRTFCEPVCQSQTSSVTTMSKKCSKYGCERTSFPKWGIGYYLVQSRMCHLCGEEALFISWWRLWKRKKWLCYTVQPNKIRMYHEHTLTRVTNTSDTNIWVYSTCPCQKFKTIFYAFKSSKGT